MKNTHGEVLLLVKLQASVLHASGQQLYLKRRSGTGGGVFLCEIFSSNIFTEQLRTTTSLWTTNSRTILLLNKNRSGRSQMFFKIVVLKNFASFTGRHLCWSLFLIKLQAWRPATLLKRDSNTTTFFTGHLWWLLLYEKQSTLFNSLSASVPLIKSSQLICTANPLTGFYVRATLGLNGLSKWNSY